LISKHPYPYPRLRADLDDYDNSSIECDIDCKETGVNLEIQGRFTLINDTLTKLINEGYATYCNELTCTATNSSELVKTSQSFKYWLQKNNYAGKLTVVPGIVMTKDFSGFRDDDLSEDYDDAEIDLHKGDLVAEAEAYDISLDREDPFATAESICRIAPGEDYNYDPTGDYILIRLPKNLFEYYEAIYKRDFSKTFAAIFVVPVLQQVIQDYWIDEIYTSENMSGLKWYSSLNNRIHDLIGEITKGTTAHDIAIQLVWGLMEDSGIILGKYYGDAQSIDREEEDNYD